MDGSAMAVLSPADLHDLIITRYVNGMGSELSAHRVHRLTVVVHQPRHTLCVTRHPRQRSWHSFSRQILIYDHLLSLGSESQLIWPAKLTSAKGLFLFIRYMVPLAMTIYTVRELCAVSAAGAGTEQPAELSGLWNLHLDNTVSPSVSSLSLIS